MRMRISTLTFAKPGDTATAAPAVQQSAPADKLFTEAEVAERIASAVAAVVPAKRASGHTVIFRQAYTKKDGTTPNLAAADIMGCFGGLPMLVKDFGISKPKDGVITVYMPSGPFRGTSSVGPVGGAIASDADVAAEATQMDADAAKAFITRHRAKKAMITALSDAIVSAWAEASKTGDPLNKPFPLNLPE